MTTESELDALLAAPLEPVADNGFSSKVEAMAAVQRRDFVLLELGAVVAALALIVFFVPAARFAAPFETVALQLGLSLPFAIACAAIVLSHATLRLLPD